jgi:hypothetical protein
VGISSLFANSCRQLAVFLLLCPIFYSLVQAKDAPFLENGNPTRTGPDAGYLLDTPTRSKIDLSGRWEYSAEGVSTGAVKVPSAYDFTGKVVFERKFEISAEQIDRYTFSLVMLGANYVSDVSVNGDFVTTHVGGYTSTVQPIAKNVLQVGGENVIRVTVNNQLDTRRTIPLRLQLWGWRNYGGILRDIFLLGTPKLSLQKVVLKTQVAQDGQSGKVLLRGVVEGIYEMPEEPRKTTTLGFYAELFEKLSGTSVATSALVPLQGKGVDTVKTDIQLQAPKLWSPEVPELYLLKCYIVLVSGKDQTVLDEYDLPCGIRRLETVGQDILLNGRKLALKGVVWNEDHPTYGSALPYEEMERDIVLIKNLGANAIRFANHPPHPYMLDLCDRYGLLVLEELPVVNAPSGILAEEHYLDVASTMMKEMISRDTYHPSVLAWGIGDEFETSTPASRTFVESLVHIAKELDSRPVYYGARALRDDVCLDLTDLACVNVYSHDLKSFRHALEEWKAACADRPVVIGRVGTEVQQGNRNGYSDPLSYEAQARFYLQRLDVVKALGLGGVFVWAFNDWKADHPSLTVRTGDPWMRTMGLVSSQREKRLAYEAVRSSYRGEKFVAMPIGNYSSSAPMVYVLSGLVLLIGSAYFYNTSRRFREGVIRSTLNAHNFFSDIRDQRVVSLVQTSLLAVIVSIASAIVVSSVLYHFRDSLLLDGMLSLFVPSDFLKERMVRFIWNPLHSILVLSAVFLVFLLLFSALVLLLAIIFKTKIYPYHAYTITVWSTPPLLLLVPVGMILYRVMESSMYVLPSLAFVGLLIVWVFFRLLKGLSIIYDVYPVKMYVIGTLVALGVAAVLFAYVDYTQSASTYWSFMHTMLRDSP